MIDNFTKYELRGDILRPPHKHPALNTIDINKRCWRDLPVAENAIEEQYGFDSYCFLALMKGATMSTPPRTGLGGIISEYIDLY